MADFDEGNGWADEPELMNCQEREPPLHVRNNRYSNAFGDYTGGYGPGGGYGPSRFFPPPDSLMGPRPPPFFMPGQGFGPRGPPKMRNHDDDSAIRYLQRCGLTKDNLKNLPRELLDLIHPQHCGLCAFSLESFTVSRMHYISKNHLKNQKKFLVKHSEGLNFRESPMKARELYCELCDVHITSKLHAESHYSGKIHKSVVEGRKNPKNPILLQPGMEERVEQLIRREKKHRKVKKAKKPTEEVINIAKNIPSELYCDICKTFVTCTEQMTMHLNGKRHLQKEKSHIFQMMSEAGEQGNTSVNASSFGSQNQLDETTTNSKELLDNEVENWSRGAGDNWDNEPEATTN